MYELGKRDDIVSQRDPVTTLSQTVNAGRTRHRGVEVGVHVPVLDNLRVDAAATYARHTYEDWVTAAATFSGKDMEAAPRSMGSLQLNWYPIRMPLRIQAEWVRLGWYWLDAANTQKYPGHDVYNLRSNLPLGNRWGVSLTVNNVTDRRYADSAQLSSNQPVLSPGLPRTFIGGVEARW